MSSKSPSQLPSFYAGLTNLGLGCIAVVLTVATARRHAWALSVVLALVVVFFAYRTFAWIRSFFRRY